jgi:hypothetical protein
MDQASPNALVPILFIAANIRLFIVTLADEDAAQLSWPDKGAIEGIGN